MKNIWKKIIIFAICMVALAFGAFYSYVSDYYKAEPLAVEAMSANQGLNIENEGDMIIFTPKTGNSDIGFVFYPGGKVEHMAYVPLMQKIANKGYTCVLLKMPFNLAVFDIDGAERAIKKISNVTSWYVGGHSLGGAMSSIYAEKNASKLKGIIFLGAYSSGDLSSTKLRMLSVYGSEDKILDEDVLEESRNYEPIEALYQVIEGGNHAYFGNYGEQEGDGKANLTNDEQQDIAAEAIASFMK